MGRPDFVEPQALVGREVDRVREVRYFDDSLVGLQVAFLDGASLIGLAWTDWALVLELREDASMPDHFYPPEDFQFRDLDLALGGAVRVGELEINEGNTLVAIELWFGADLVVLRSYGGDIRVDYPPPV